MKQHLKQNRKLYLWIFLLSLLCFARYLFLNKGLMVFYGDPFEIYYKLWQGGWQSVHNGTFGEFCWSLGLGASTFSYVFYFITSPYFWISCLLPESFIPYSFLFWQVVNMTIGFILTDLWLYKAYSNRTAAIVGSFAITFCAYAFFYTQAPQLEYLFVCYPLILYFTECFIQDKKWKGLVLSIGVTGIWNYYVLYMFAAFLILYTVLRYVYVHQGESISEILKAALRYAGYAILGIGLSAVILLPCGYLVLSMPRFSSNSTDISLLLNIKQIYRILSSLFLPAFEKLDANPLINIDNVESYGWSGGCSLYSLVITPLLFPYLLKLKDKKEKTMFLVFFAFLLIFLLFPIFSYIFQMTIDTRFYYMYVFFNGMLITRVVKGLATGELEASSLKKYYIVLVIVYVILIGISVLFRLNTTKLTVLAVLTCIAMLVFAYLYLRVFTSGFSSKKLVILLSVEALFAGCVYGYRNEPIVAWALEDSALSTSIGDYLSTIEDDTSFYRVMYDSKTIVTEEHEDYDDDTFMVMSSNEPYANNYKGFGFYESLYNTNQEEFLSRMKSTWNMWQMVGRVRTHNMLSAKYWYTYDFSDPVPYGYTWIYTDEEAGFQVYENRNYVELGYTYDKTINSEYLYSLPILEQDRIMDEYLAVEDSTNTDYETNDNITLLTTLPTDDVRVYTFEEPVTNSIIYIENYGLPNLKITTRYLGEIVNTYDIWEFNYTDIPVYDDPIDQIVIEAEALYGGETEVPLYIEPMDGLLDEQFEEYTSEHFENVIAETDKIEADITVNDHEKYVFTSVPYDEGWTVYVDGEEIDYEKVQLGFIGFKLSEGTHHVTFVYHAPGLRSGMIVSVISLFIFLILIVIEKRKSN